MNFVIYAIPAFFALILIELWNDWRNNKQTYRFNDAINSLNLGMMSQITGIAKKTIQFSFYLFVFNYFSLTSLGTESWLMWGFAFVAYDFCYYWNHRLSHEINVLWASHVVHHQSEEYNLTTALRQTSGGIFGFVFYLPLAFIGIDPYVLISVGSLNLIYQFWVHTKHIDQMPKWYEAVFVTPSNHRVHHAQNPVYIDKNHGGVFIIWDRLFGTYHPELPEEPVIFGVTKPLASWNPVWANLEVYWGLLLDAVRTKRWRDKIAVWFKRTGWRPDDVQQQYPSPVFDPYQQKKFDIALSGRQKGYVFFQHLTLIVVVLYYLLTAPSLNNLQILAGAGLLIFTLFTLGHYQQRRKGAVLLETIKNTLLAAVTIWHLELHAGNLVWAIAWFVIAMLWLNYANQQVKDEPAFLEQL